MHHIFLFVTHTCCTPLILRNRGSSYVFLLNMCFWHLRPKFEIPFKAHIEGKLKLYQRIEMCFNVIFLSYNQVVINHQNGGD
jgi:hypothetical protein